MTLAEIKRLNKESGGNWFDPDWMRHFKTELFPDSVREGPGGVYFVTAETNPRGTRRFSVRRFKDGQIDTIGEFHSFETKREALAVARKMAATTSIKQA